MNKKAPAPKRPVRTQAAVLSGGIALAAIVLSGALVEISARADTTGISDSDPAGMMEGRRIYEHICQGCHMANADGAVGAARYPALSKNPALVSRQYMALTILMGRRNMPAFGAKYATGFGGPPVTLNEAQIAAVINYVRTNFGNHYTDSITAAEVGALDRNTR
ncbi:MAG TPA: cytochrome c [Steroidobacteraceae bacterium]|jgi:mono/diheme cytochrome c family protein|nr:cytochrome c [Steroidobacteraceae bacterium]